MKPPPKWEKETNTKKLNNLFQTMIWNESVARISMKTSSNAGTERESFEGQKRAITTEFVAESRQGTDGWTKMEWGWMETGRVGEGETRIRVGRGEGQDWHEGGEGQECNWIWMDKLYYKILLTTLLQIRVTSWRWCFMSDTRNMYYAYNGIQNQIWDRPRCTSTRLKRMYAT